MYCSFVQYTHALVTGTGAACNFINLPIINNLKRSHAAYNIEVTSSLCSRVW